MIIEQIAQHGPQYKPYVPTRTENLIDGVVRFFSPERALKRMVHREEINFWRHNSAKSNDVRPNSGPHSSGGATLQGDKERRQIMWNSLSLLENSGLATSIKEKIVTYVCGSLRYQSRTGVKTINNEYEAYIKQRLGRGIDYAGVRSGRQLIATGLGGRIVKGDFGLNLVREDSKLYVQGIEADRIGNPYEYRANDSYVGGIHLNPRSSAKVGFDIFRRDRSGMYRFDVYVPARTPTLGLPNFLFSANLGSFDDIRGKSLFATSLDCITFIEKIKEYELQAMLWASSQSGVYYTATGRLPGDLPFHRSNVEIDQASGKPVTRFSVKPNQITALGLAERVEMFKNERPSPNVVAMYHNTVREIALSAALSFGFVYEMTGTGPAVRYYSSQDKRTLDRWKADLKEDVISPLIVILLMEGIDNGDIPYHPEFYNHEIIFPPHPTIDAGRESAADINENVAGLKSGASIVAEQAEDFEEVQEQCALEVENAIRLAMDVAKRLKLDDWREVFGMLRAGKTIQMSPVFEAARAEQLDSQAKAAEDAKRQQDKATSDGRELE